MTRTLSVWAPSPRRVVAVVNGVEHLMSRLPSGWWVVEVECEVGSRYGFSLDGADPVPDPRSPSQPDGVHGLSAIVDHGAFEWHDESWRGTTLRGAVLYECHVGTFTEAGTFDGVAAHLGHLVDLGVTTLELMPVASFPGERGWGYDGVGLFAPQHSYGGPDGLKRLVDACHAAGLAVVLDVVYNHFGPSGNHLATFGPYFTDEHTTTWGDAMNFEGPGSHEVRRFVVDNACSWVRDYHVDGLRLDAVHAISDRSAVHVVEQLTTEVAALATDLGRSVVVIAESDLNDPRFVRDVASGGYGADAAWADDWHHALHTVLTGERSGYYADFGSLDQLVKALVHAWVYDGVYSVHRDAVHGRPPDGLGADRFVVATQNHDQIGNRACGERLAGLVSTGRLKVAAALLLTSPFVPLLFQGEEWAASTPFLYFTDHDDPEVGAAVTQGRRDEFSSFGWDPDDVPDPQQVTTFTQSILRWDEQDKPPHREVLDWYRELCALRRTHASLHDADLDRVTALGDAAAGHLVVTRGDVEVIVNLGTSPWEVPVHGGVLAGSEPTIALAGHVLSLPPDSVAIVGMDDGADATASQEEVAG